MAKLKITMIKSTIACKPAHRATMAALGLKKLGQEVIQEDNAAIRGMIAKVPFLVKVEEYTEGV
jgi:large subunit ribosomal protein L30